MIKLSFTILFIFFNILVCKAQNEVMDDATTWKHFVIFVRESEDTLFRNLSDDLNLNVNDKDEFDIEYQRGKYGDYILGGKYQIVVNLSDEREQMQYLTVGDYFSKNVEKDHNAMRFAWSQLSLNTQKRLLSWRKENKIHIDKLPINDEDENNPRTWKYFKILARYEDDDIFKELQDDMGISPKLESYTIVINIMSKNTKEHYIVLGDESDPSSLRFYWARISIKVQNGLINWAMTNKIRMSEIENYKSNNELYTEVINSKPKFTKLYYLYYLRGRGYLRVWDSEKAVEDFNTVEQLKPDFNYIFVKRASAYSSLGDYGKALEDYNSALRYDSENVELYGYRGEVLYKMKKYEEAITDLKRAIEADSFNYMIEIYKWYIKDAETKIKQNK